MELHLGIKWNDRPYSPQWSWDFTIQSDNILVKVAPGSQEAGHGHGGKGDGLMPPNGGNTPPKRVSPNRSGRTGHKYISQWCWVMRFR